MPERLETTCRLFMDWLDLHFPESTETESQKTKSSNKVRGSDRS